MPGGKGLRHLAWIRFLKKWHIISTEKQHPRDILLVSLFFSPPPPFPPTGKHQQDYYSSPDIIWCWAGPKPYTKDRCVLEKKGAASLHHMIHEISCCLKHKQLPGMLEKAAWSSLKVFSGLASYRNNSATENSHQLLSFASVCPVFIQHLKLLVGNRGVLSMSVSERSATFGPSFWSGRHPQTCTEESYWPPSLWERLASSLTGNHF